jgi:hypothetical protein
VGSMKILQGVYRPVLTRFRDGKAPHDRSDPLSGDVGLGSTGDFSLLPEGEKAGRL